MFIFTESLIASNDAPTYLTIAILAVLTVLITLVIICCCKLHWQAGINPEQTIYWQASKAGQEVMCHLPDDHSRRPQRYSVSPATQMSLAV